MVANGGIGVELCGMVRPMVNAEPHCPRADEAAAHREMERMDGNTWNYTRGMVEAMWQC